MSLELRRRIFDQLDALVLVDPHTHINALNPASQTLADILGYHYYTELAHSAGMPREQIEEPGISPKEKVGRLIARMGPIDNTIQYSWLVEMCQSLFGFQDSAITVDNWETLYDKAEAQMSAPDWAHQVMSKSKLEALFLTNDFDDPLEGFDTNIFIPCLRTDDLVFHLAKPAVQQRLADSTGVEITSAATLRYAIGGLFQYFKEKNARACAISLPPGFTPTPVSDARADTAIAALYRDGVDAHESHRKAASNFVFWTLAQYCAIYQLPFDLMIGVNRSVYPAGVHQGMDLYDSRVSLIQYQELFNAFPNVTFPVSVLASVTNQELASYAWIFPNVVTNGHWWYSNTPTFIEHDCAARLEAVPRTKQIGYYSDMYKLEFALPKFAMYKRILAKVLAERYVIDRSWSEEQAIALGQQILRGNVDTIFAKTPMPEFPAPVEEEVPEVYSAAGAMAAQESDAWNAPASDDSAALESEATANAWDEPAAATESESLFAADEPAPEQSLADPWTEPLEPTAEPIANLEESPMAADASIDSWLDEPQQPTALSPEVAAMQQDDSLPLDLEDDLEVEDVVSLDDDAPIALDEPAAATLPGGESPISSEDDLLDLEDDIVVEDVVSLDDEPFALEESQGATPPGGEPAINAEEEPLDLGDDFVFEDEPESDESKRKPQ